MTRTPEEFADEYAQTITYAFLLARVDGVGEVTVDSAANQLEGENELLAQVLRVLGQPEARAIVQTAIELLERYINRIDPSGFTERAPGEHGKDPWLYFYEDFLKKYDPVRRQQYGVYYTPVQVVSLQVRLIAELLKDRFERRFTFLDNVALLDPAVGTGSYLLAALAYASASYAEEYGPEALGERVGQQLRHILAFERFVGPYAIAHLRLSQLTLKYGVNPEVLKSHGLRVFLTDTLSDPNKANPYQPELFARRLSEESKLADEVKRETPVFVCIGNPPYRRARDEDGEFGGWVRHGSGDGAPALIDAFIEPLRAAGRGSAANTLHELSVYFWRWALWKVYEQEDGPGIISFISPRAFLTGPGHPGMRQVMRERFDEMWIIDLGGDNRGAVTAESDNVFAIETGVCITIGVRYGSPNPTEPAHAHYTFVDGTRAEKLATLDSILSFDDQDWLDCPDEWQGPLLGATDGGWEQWPDIRDLLPWQISGAQFKRLWPIGESEELLEQRWNQLLSLGKEQRRIAFGETRDRLAAAVPPGERQTKKLTGIEALPQDAPLPQRIRYSYRALDRQWALYDDRLGDFIRESLYATCGAKQIFFSTLMTKRLGAGPAFTATECMPDLDFFCNRGAKDIIPMFRDAAGLDPNVTPGLSECLAERYGMDVSAEDIFAYVAAIMAGPSYVETFKEPLRTPGPRIPITASADLFSEGVALGRRFAWLQTYGQRWVPKGERRGRLPRYDFKVAHPIPQDEESYPRSYSYDAATQTLHVGSGAITGLTPEVWGYSSQGGVS